MAFIFGGHDDQLVVGVLVGLEAAHDIEGPVAGVPVGGGDAGRAGRGALDDHDLVSVRVEGAQAVARERFPVQDDDPERDARPGGAAGAGAHDGRAGGRRPMLAATVRSPGRATGRPGDSSGRSASAATKARIQSPMG